MPKGKHKGGRRQFTNFEALEEQKKKEEKEKQWRKTQGQTDSEDEEGGEDEKSSGSSEESSSESEEEQRESKPKGVSALIETKNPNRIVNKPKKVSELSPTAGAGSGKPQLSRREREEIEKQRATAHYRKMHSEGKTEEARSDLARLAIIKQQREEAAKKRDDERQAREEAAAAKKDKMARALNKKS